MFSSFTWSDFITCAGSLAALYYALSTPWLYRHEIKNKLKRSNTSPAKQENSLTQSLMGKARSPHSIRSKEITEEEPVITATITPLSETTQPSIDTRPLNLISALMLEANTLASVIAGSAGTEQDVNSMFRSMLEHYNELRQSAYFGSINVFLLNTCVKEGLPVTATQVESWWAQSTPSA